jgi:hypothetical protein
MKALSLAIVVWCCAGCMGSLPPCRALDANARERWLIGEGEADAAASEARESARKRALAAIAEQIDVAVASSATAVEAERHAGGSITSSASFETRVATQTSLDLQGVEILETCGAGDRLRVRAGLDRQRAARDAEARLGGVHREMRALMARAQAANQAGDVLDEIGALSAAVPIAEKADRIAVLARVLGARLAPGAVADRSYLERSVREALGRASIGVEVSAPEGQPLLAGAARACLAKIGLPASNTRNPAADATLVLDVIVHPALRVADGLFVTRANVSAALHRRAATALAGGGAQVKGGGDTAERAQHDAVRRIAVEALPGLIDRTVGSLGWNGLAQCR